MQLILACVGVLLIIATWQYLWKPAALDLARDRLFDLRDDHLREYFVQRGIPLSHPLYITLRDLINGHLRHTESGTFLRFVVMSSWVSQHQDVCKSLRAKFETRFMSTDPELAILTHQVRTRATKIMLAYVVETSPVALPLVGLVALPLLAYWVLLGVWKRVCSGADQATSSLGLVVTALVTALVAMAKLAGYANRNIAQWTMEEYAMDDECRA